MIRASYFPVSSLSSREVNDFLFGLSPLIVKNNVLRRLVTVSVWRITEIFDMRVSYYMYQLSKNKTKTKDI